MSLLAWSLALLLSFGSLTPQSLASIVFDKVDDVASCLSPAAFDALGDFSVAAWINAADSGENSFGTIIQKAGTSAGFTGWRFRFVDTTLEIELTIDYNTTDKNKPTSTQIVANAWTCVVATDDGTAESDNTKIYINGTEASYGTGVDGATTRTDDSANNVLIGNTSNSTRTFNGSISDVAMWGTALSAAQANQVCGRVRRLNTQINAANLLLYVPLDDEAFGTSWDGDTAQNMIGSGNNCTGDNGANNTGLTAGSSPLTYP